MADAITNGMTIVTASWDFISGNPILFGACALGIIGTGLTMVKGLFS